MATIKQMVARSMGVHRRILRARVDGQPIVNASTSDSSWRGYRTARNTLCRWGALGEGDGVTEVGLELLAALGRERCAVMSRSIPDLLAERQDKQRRLFRARDARARESLIGQISYLDILIADLRDEDRDLERAPTATYFDLSDEGSL